MLQTILSFLYCFSCILLVLLILIQKGKGSLGLGSGFGGGSQMLFGGSGGQDLFQKVSWILGTILMGGGLLFGIWKFKAHKRNSLSRINLPISAPAKTADEGELDKSE